MKIYSGRSVLSRRIQYINQPLAMHFIHLLMPVCITWLLTACNSSQDVQSDASVTNSSASLSNDMAIATALYLDERTPDSFYQENLQADTFYTLSHVNNTDLLPVADRSVVAVYELSSDDFNEALMWSEQAALLLTAYNQLVANSESDLYFQFSRFNTALPQVIQLQRIFKSSVLDRSGVDRNNENADYKGRITITDLTTEKVKQIIEYLWMFSLSNNYLNAILDSYTTETPGEYIHTMHQANMSLSNNANCDAVEIYEIRYTIPKASGFIWRDKTLSRTFSARRNGNRIMTCE